jgi:protein-L-isoaspartate(D-aspartate) O-methyltransferase
MDYENQIEHMLQSVKEYLGIFSTGNAGSESIEKILSALRAIDRKFFIDPETAYIDDAMPIGHDQTISQPSTVGMMLLLADIKEGEDILEIGLGSGWSACLLAYLSYPGKVISVDIIDELTRSAQENIRTLSKNLAEADKKRLDHITLRRINVFKEIGWLSGFSFDKIIIMAGIDGRQREAIEQFALEYLSNDGILVVPHVSGPIMVIRKANGELAKSYTEDSYAFVPLITD